MACKKSRLKIDEVVSIWFGKGHLPVRGKIRGFTPKYIKAWVKKNGSNTYIREDGCTIEDPPKIFYLTEEQVSKLKKRTEEIFKNSGFVKL